MVEVTQKIGTASSQRGIDDMGIKGGEWLKHFSTLLAPRDITGDTCEKEPDDIWRSTTRPTGMDEDEEPINEKEIERAITQLREGKASFFDNIDNTFIKCLHAANKKFLRHFMSLILVNDIYPD